MPLSPRHIMILNDGWKCYHFDYESLDNPPDDIIILNDYIKITGERVRGGYPGIKFVLNFKGLWTVFVAKKYEKNEI